MSQRRGRKNPRVQTTCTLYWGKCCNPLISSGFHCIMSICPCFHYETKGPARTQEVPHHPERHSHRESGQVPSGRREPVEGREGRGAQVGEDRDPAGTLR